MSRVIAIAHRLFGLSASMGSPDVPANALLELTTGEPLLELTTGESLTEIE